MKRVISILAITILIITGIGTARAEEREYNPLYVTATLLNGRAEPSKKASMEAIFDRGDRLVPTGRWSESRAWVEVYGGEGGTVWVSVKYVSERMEPYTVTNENNGKIKIRSKPGEGRVKGYVKHGRSVMILQAVLGYGRCAQGWIDLEYLIEE